MKPFFPDGGIPLGEEAGEGGRPEYQEAPEGGDKDILLTVPPTWASGVACTEREFVSIGAWDRAISIRTGRMGWDETEDIKEAWDTYLVDKLGEG